MINGFGLNDSPELNTNTDSRQRPLRFCGKSIKLIMTIREEILIDAIVKMSESLQIMNSLLDGMPATKNDIEKYNKAQTLVQESSVLVEKFKVIHNG